MQCFADCWFNSIQRQRHWRKNLLELTKTYPQRVFSLPYFPFFTLWEMLHHLYDICCTECADRDCFPPQYEKRERFLSEYLTCCVLIWATVNCTTVSTCFLLGFKQKVQQQDNQQYVYTMHQVSAWLCRAWVGVATISSVIVLQDGRGGCRDTFTPDRCTYTQCDAKQRPNRCPSQWASVAF